jgi:mycoredoxin
LTYPTVRFDDGSALTNPSIVQVKKKLAAMAV